MAFAQLLWLEAKSDFGYGIKPNGLRNLCRIVLKTVEANNRKLFGVSVAIVFHSFFLSILVLFYFS